jgi:DNA-directed RNA polymerase subunit F
LPVGDGLFSYITVEEAKDSINEVLKNYKRHSLAARELALSHFAYQVVLPPLLEKATTKPERI